LAEKKEINMSTITVEQVKELRDVTGVSIMQCRKALEEAGGDMEKATILLRKKGAEIADKKADRNAADGTVAIKTDGKKALVLILNCETDFVARNEDFVKLSNTILELAWNEGEESARAKAPALINDVVLKIGENIQLGKIEEVSGDVVGSYIHHTGKAGCVVVLKGGSADVAKDIAMHVTAMKPRYLTTSEVSDEEKASAMEALRKEVDDAMKQSNKPEEMKQKIMEGKIAAYFKEQTLTEQSFFKNPEKTISQYAKDNGATVEKFVLYNV
jgi:elongation factor Ts